MSEIYFAPIFLGIVLVSHGYGIQRKAIHSNIKGFKGFAIRIAGASMIAVSIGQLLNIGSITLLVCIGVGTLLYFFPDINEKYIL